MTIGRSKSVVNVPMASGMRYWLGPVFESFAGAWSRNIVAESRENLLAFAAVYSCVSLIAADIAKLRMKLMRNKGGIWSEVTSGHPALAVLRRPNHWQTRIQFLATWMTNLLLYGNAYVYIERKAGKVDSLYPLDARCVSPLVSDNGFVYYRINGNHLAQLPLGDAAMDAHDVIHDRVNPLWHPLVGVSPIYACGSSATHGIRIQNNAATFFGNMSRPSGTLTAPGGITDEVAQRLKSEFEQNFSGGNLGRLLVMGDGLKYEPMAIPPDQAQLIEQLRWTAEDVARAFQIPNHKLGIGVPTLTNVVALNQDYYSQCLQTKIEAIEELLGIAFGLKEDMRIELDLDGLLRMDPVSQIDVLQKGVAAAILSPNEARAKLGLDPVSGGAEPIAQQQNWPLSVLAQRPAPTDPAPGGPSKGGYSYTTKNVDGETETIYFRTKSEMHAFMIANSMVAKTQKDLSGQMVTK